MDSRVVIVGAGVAGLACAKVLHKRGVPFTIVEKSARPGGRIKTDLVDGYRLDRGFQVLQTGYPDIGDHLDLASLRIEAFPAGVAVRRGGRFHVIADPRRHPGYLRSTLLSPVGTVADRLRMMRLAASLSRRDMEAIFTRAEKTALEFLRARGFSERFIASFFAPFFAGACLDPGLRGSSRVLQYLIRLFATGDATLPADGMGAIPDQLAAGLPAGSISCDSEVVAVEEGAVTLADGRTIQGEAIVVATEEPVACGLLGRDCRRRSVGETCLYFSADWRPPFADPFLALNGDGSGPINNIAFPSMVAASYAPPGRTLIAVVVVDDDHGAREDLERLVLDQCREWFGPAVDTWEHLRTYRIVHALTDQLPPTDNPYAPPDPDSRVVRICGEHRSVPGLQWSLMSGAMAGGALAEQMAADRHGDGPSSQGIRA